MLTWTVPYHGVFKEASGSQACVCRQSREKERSAAERADDVAAQHAFHVAEVRRSSSEEIHPGASRQGQQRPREAMSWH